MITERKWSSLTMKLNLPFELVVLLCAFWEVWRQHTVFVAGNLGRQVWLEQYETQVAIGEREIEQFVDCNNRCVCVCVFYSAHLLACFTLKVARCSTRMALMKDQDLHACVHSHKRFNRELERALSQAL